MTKVPGVTENPLFGNDEVADEKSLADLLAEWVDNDDVTIMVYRDTGGKGAPYVMQFSPGDYSMPDLCELLRDEYDGGNFRIDVRDKSGWLAKRKLSIEKPRRKSVSREADSVDGIEKVVRMMQESNQTMMNSMRDLMSGFQVQALQSQNELLSGLISKGGANSGGNDVIQLLTLAKDLFGRKSGGDGSDVETFLRGLQMGQELGGGSSDDSFTTALKTLGGPLAEITARLGSMNYQKKAQQQAIGVEAPKNHSGQVENENEGSDMSFMAAMLQNVVGMMLNAAQQNADPDVYANMLLDQFGDLIAQRVGDDGEYENLFAMVPDAAAHREWFDKVRECILGYIGETNQDATGNSQNDAKPPKPAAIPKAAAKPKGRA